MTPHISRKRLDTFLKDLGAVQLDNLHNSRWVKPCDLGNHSLGPNRKQPSVMMDFKPLNCVHLCVTSLSSTPCGPHKDSSNINTSGQTE